MSIEYYTGLIHKSNEKIEKYRRQIAGLQKFETFVEGGRNKSSKTISKRRTHINQTKEFFLKHPSMKRLTINLADAIDVSYEHSVSDNYESVKEEIMLVIKRLKNKIDDEKDKIAYYRRMIIELEEEERRRQEEEQKREMHA